MTDAIIDHSTLAPSLLSFTNRPRMMLEEAIVWSGYLDKPIFPVNAGLGPRAKTPLTKNGFYDATKDPQTIKAWFENTGAMIGLPTGKASGLLVVDIDIKKGKDGLRSLQEWEATHGTLPATYTVKTPSGGFHLYFQQPEGIHIGSGVDVLGVGLDIRADGGYVVAAGSINEAWQEYEAETDYPIALAPQHLLNFLNKPSKEKAKPITDNTISDGSRNTSLFRVLCSLYGMGLTSKELLQEAAVALNKLLCKPPLNENELGRVVESIFRYEPAYALDNMGNAERFADVYSTVTKCLNGKEWLVYSNGIYLPDSRREVNEMAKRIAKDIEAESKHANAPDSKLDSDIAKALNKLAKKTKDAPLAMLPLAASVPSIAADIQDFDKNTHLINCKNCTIDLNAITAIEHSPTHLFTKQVNASFIPEAVAPTWDEFLLYAMEEDKDLIEFLARLYGGVGLYGGNPEQVMAILFGHGSNGKSIFAEAIRFVMGPYSDVIRQEVLMANTMQSVRHDIADIKGARFLLASEPPPGAKLNASVIKEMTGGDMMKGRHNYGNSVRFACEGLITLVTNWEPEIESGDDAIKRRLLLIPFSRTVPEEKRDPLLSQKLQAEADGILAWLVRGRADYVRRGKLDVPERVKRATDGYKTDMDCFEQFLSSECVLESAKKEQADNLYKAYQRKMFDENNIKKQLPMPNFYKLLARRFPKTAINGRTYYKGIELRSKAT